MKPLGLSIEEWTAIGSFAGAIAAIFSFVGLVFVAIGLRQSTKAAELQVLESIFHDIRELDREYIERFEGYSPGQRSAWSATFFNTVEYLCFVMNHGVAEHKALIKFFMDAVPVWEQMHTEHCQLGIIRDRTDNFSEFKRTAQLARKAKKV